ncbi:MAG: hypothetical protein HQK98_05885 [Nitrospirae bacterium]|nr:hypothetical protein [Nitrospirota bacterium]
MRKSVTAVLVVAVLAVLGCFALIQADSGAKDGVKSKEMSEFRQKIKALKKKKIVEALALNKDTADKVLSVIDKYDSKIHESMRSMRDDIKSLKKAVAENKDDAAKRAIIDKITQSRKDLISLKQAEMDELKGILSVDQQARYILFSIDFHMAIRKIMAEKWSNYDNESKGD